MELEGGVLVSPTAEVPVVDGDVVTAIRTLADRGVGKKTIAREVGVAVNTVRRYLRQPVVVGVQIRPAARRLSDAHRRMARVLYEGAATDNAVVVQRLLAAHDVTVSVRTVERAVADIRQAQRAAAVATVRVETPPGDQLQVDFDQQSGPDRRRARADLPDWLPSSEFNPAPLSPLSSPDETIRPMMMPRDRDAAFDIRPFVALFARVSGEPHHFPKSRGCRGVEYPFNSLSEDSGVPSASRRAAGFAERTGICCSACR